MKTIKKVLGQEHGIEAIISGGKAEVETVKKRNVGRPKSKDAKVQCLFYLPEDIVQAIDKNCRGQ